MQNSGDQNFLTSGNLALDLAKRRRTRNATRSSSGSIHSGGLSIVPTEGMFAKPKSGAGEESGAVKKVIRRVNNDLAEILNKADLRTATKGIDHVCLAMCGQMGSGKSTIAGQLLLRMGTVSLGDTEKIKKELMELGGGINFEPSYFLDTTVGERVEGHSAACSTNEFYTDRWCSSVPPQ